jgi:hypothetical protein
MGEACELGDEVTLMPYVVLVIACGWDIGCASIPSAI